MAKLLSFEDHALTQLRERLGEAEEARADLIAFAQGHAGAVTAIHDAVLAAIAAPCIDELFEVVTRDWPGILAIDSIALALIVNESAFRADRGGVQRIEPRLVQRLLANSNDVVMRSVKRGQPLFGPAAAMVRAEALIRFECGKGLPRGLLLLGQVGQHQLDTRHGAHLLRFLGRSLGAMIARWLTARDD